LPLTFSLYGVLSQGSLKNNLPCTIGPATGDCIVEWRTASLCKEKGLGIFYKAALISIMAHVAEAISSIVLGFGVLFIK
uniref:Uncharacterized protein n=1 Tax=Gopherus agassizii TaxID=38772 RepID=A0A452IUS0_9SAUR